MAIVKRRLNENDIDLLKKIYEFGGYATSISIANYHKIDISNIRRFLHKLTDEGYLKEIKFYSDSRKDVTVYQVTFKTCKMFDNPGSYFRKKHGETYIIRALIKQHFFFEICGGMYKYIVADHEERVRILTEEMGFNMGLLPKKRDGDTASVHVEEYIIDARNIEDGKAIYCPKTGEKIIDFNSGNKGVVVVYIDRSTDNYYAQLMSLYNRYKSMIEQHKVRFQFLIVVDSESRETCYKKVVLKLEDILRDNKTDEELFMDFARLHRKILIDRVGIEPGKVVDLDIQAKKKYMGVRDLTAEDFAGIPIEKIRLQGLKAVEKLAAEITDSALNKDEKLKKTTEFFRKIYRLCAAGKLKKLPAFDVRVYRTGRQFSI